LCDPEFSVVDLASLGGAGGLINNTYIHQGWVFSRVGLARHEVLRSKYVHKPGGLRSSADCSRYENGRLVTRVESGRMRWYARAASDSTVALSWRSVRGSADASPRVGSCNSLATQRTLISARTDVLVARASRASRCCYSWCRMLPSARSPTSGVHVIMPRKA
jgi:hypothetical protein